MASMTRLLLLGMFGFALAWGQAPSYDVIIEGGRIADGTGNPWFYGDIAIQGDRIAAAGLLRDASARVRLRVSGLTVAPGFIDAHSHARGGIFQSPQAENYIRQGVTTLIEGPDGSSPLPIGRFLAEISRLRKTVNFGTLVGHGSIRQQVLSTENRKASPEEIQRMKEMVRQAMREGAMGLSTGLFYVPGNYAPTEEVIELAKVAGELGGVHTSHMRDEAAQVRESVRETIRIGEEGGLPTQVTHHKVIGKSNWGASADTLRLMDEARARGVDVTADQYPYTASSTGTGALFPQWALSGGIRALKERLAAPGQRTKIKAAIVDKILNDRGGGDPANIYLASCAFDRSLAGKTLAEVTRMRGREVTPENAAETAIEVHTAGGCSAVYHAMDEQDVERIMRYPHTMIASDGGIPAFGVDVPHPRHYGAFARVLGRYVREKKALSLEEAIRKMTSLPANRFGLWDRGLLRPGMKADIVVFDAETIIDRAEFGRPHQYAEGVRHVFVNGQAVLLDGKLTGARPGETLYGPAWQGGSRVQ
jgi:N-acyl-D-amino-acid deacylase